MDLPVRTTCTLAGIRASMYVKWGRGWILRSIGYTLPVVFVAYPFVTIVSNLQVVSPWILVFPAYALLRVLVMSPVGAFTISSSPGAVCALGRYGFGYRRRRPELDEPKPGLLTPVAVV